MSVFITSGGFKYLIKGITTGVAPGAYVGWGEGTGQTTSSTTLAQHSGNFSAAASGLGWGGIGVTWSATMIAGGVITASEVGLFTGNVDGTSGSTLIVYGEHTAVPLEAADQIAYTFTCKFI